MDKGKAFDMPSGAKFFVSVSSYELVMTLHDALANELRGKGIGQLDIVEIQKAIRKESQVGLNVLADKALGLAASKELKAAIFACGAKGVYKPDGTDASSIQLDPAVPGYGIFDNPKCLESAREDFYAICSAICEVNLRPFAKALSSLLSAHVGRVESTQGSNTEQAPAKPN